MSLQPTMSQATKKKPAKAKVETTMDWLDRLLNLGRKEAMFEAEDEFPAGTDVYTRDGKIRGKATGGLRHCALESCGGIRVGVRWPDGKLTWPCMKGMIFDSNNKSRRPNWRIE
jgi:hypothetical protein